MFLIRLGNYTEPLGDPKQCIAVFQHMFFLSAVPESIWVFDIHSSPEVLELQLLLFLLFSEDIWDTDHKINETVLDKAFYIYIYLQLDV